MVYREVQYITNKDALCWDCINCDESCCWVRAGIVPDGAAIMKKPNKEQSTVIVNCPRFEKDKKGSAAAWQSRGDMEAYSALRDYIVKSTVQDYINAMLVIKLFGEDKHSLRIKDAVQTKRQCERFFNSEYFAALSERDGKAFAKELRDKTDELWESVKQTVLDGRKLAQNTPKILQRNRTLIKAIAIREERCKEL